jgi:hypothetical protein
MPGPYTSSDTRNYVGLAKQAVKGTGVVPATFVAAIDDVDLSHNQEITGHKELGGSGSITLAEKLGHMPGGGFGFRARPSLSGRLAAYLLGSSPAPTDLTNGPFRHTITPDITVATYVSVENNLADEAIERFIDSVISQLSFEVSNADTQIVRSNGQWLAGDAGSYQGAATAETYETDTPFTLTEGAWTIDGTVRTNVQRFTCTVAVRYAVEKLSGPFPKHVIKLGVDVSGELEQLALNDDDEYRLTNYGTAVATAPSASPTSGSVVVDFSRSTAGNAAYRQLKLDVPALDWTEARYTPLNAEGTAVKVTRSYTGRKGTNPIITITSSNLVGTSFLA